MTLVTSAPASPENPQALFVILRAGLLCGVMDITAAFVTWAPRGITPARILRGIASALLGPPALRGGSAIVALGLALHFFIAFSATTVFYAASRKLTFMTRRPVPVGVLYGVAVYTVMYWVVLPLSNYRRGPFSFFNTVVAIITHMICVGLPISLIVHRYSHR